MNNSQVQIQQQTERQLQKLTPQQLLNARLIELPLVEFEDRVKTELLDNIALEEGHDSTDDEAADIDGASPWQKFWYVTLPLLKPTTIYVLTISLAFATSYFI